MTTTYCTRNDIASLIGEPGILACIDDNQDGQEQASESAYVTDAINRAAAEINQKIHYQYPTLADLANNDWLRWCNANLAAYYLQSRRGNVPSGIIAEATANYKDMLEEIRWGRSSIPEQDPQAEYTPTVTTLIPEFTNPTGPIAVDQTLSTGASPGYGRKRNTARTW